MINAIVTIPPYAPFIHEVAAHPLVSALRLNTVMPLRETPQEVLARLATHGKPLWVDLKGRQLRVAGAAVPPYTEVRLSHPIEVETPARIWFGDGREAGVIAACEGDRLILEDGPRRLIGPGESVNIDPAPRVLGTLTYTDRAYLAAMRALGLLHVMLSFAEEPGDARDVREHLPHCELMLKIESMRGVDFARRGAVEHGRLMAARGDLYVELLRPERMVSALRDIVAADPNAVVASRLFSSLAYGEAPQAADISDVAWLMGLGFQTFMLGDEVCLRRDSVMAALDLLGRVAAEMELAPARRRRAA
jgi:pyruvate kinase